MAVFDFWKVDTLNSDENTFHKKSQIELFTYLWVIIYGIIELSFINTKNPGILFHLFNGSLYWDSNIVLLVFNQNDKKLSLVLGKRVYLLFWDFSKVQTTLLYNLY